MNIQNKYNIDSLLSLCILCDFNTKKVMSYLPSNKRDFYRSFISHACRFGRSLKVFYESK